MILKNITWIFLLICSNLLGQIEKQVPGTYILEEKIGLHIVHGVSYGDYHPTSYASSIDTTITHTLILDSLYGATFVSDTVFDLNITAPSFNPRIKMYGKWRIEKDTLSIQYLSVDTIYNYVKIKDTIVGYINDVKYKIVPEKERQPTNLETPILERFKIIMYEKNALILVPLNETRAWIRYRKQ